MCRNVNHGGRRCPEADNPVKRRYRRKASDLTQKTIETLPKKFTQQNENAVTVGNLNFDYESQINEIKERISGTKPENVTQEAWDSETEIKITTLGINIAAEAENLISYDAGGIENLIKAKYDNLLGSLSDEEKETINKEELRLKAEAQVHTETLQSLTVAYQTVIEKVRKVGGTVAFNSESVPEGVELVNNTIGKYYPSDWLDEHAKAGGNDMVIRTVNILNERPSYVKPGELTRGAFVEGEKAEWLKNTDLTSFENVKVVNMETIDGRELVYVVHPDETHKVNLHFMQRQGWEQKQSINMLNDETSNLSLEEKVNKQVWVKKKIIEKPLLNVYPPLAEAEKKAVSGTWYETVAEAYAFHEFGHRIEDVMPDKIVPRLEKAFLMRRSGLSSENLYKNVEVDNRGEVYVQGDFVNKYVGKLYPEQDNYEVLTTGLEGLYGNNYGGFIGANNVYRKKDEDHRGFVLGLLASV